MDKEKKRRKVGQHQDSKSMRYWAAWITNFAADLSMIFDNLILGSLGLLFTIINYASAFSHAGFLSDLIPSTADQTWFKYLMQVIAACLCAQGVPFFFSRGWQAFTFSKDLNTNPYLKSEDEDILSFIKLELKRRTRRNAKRDGYRYMLLGIIGLAFNAFIHYNLFIQMQFIMHSDSMDLDSNQIEGLIKYGIGVSVTSIILDMMVGLMSTTKLNLVKYIPDLTEDEMFLSEMMRTLQFQLNAVDIHSEAKKQSQMYDMISKKNDIERKKAGDQFYNDLKEAEESSEKDEGQLNLDLKEKDDDTNSRHKTSRKKQEKKDLQAFDIAHRVFTSSKYKQLQEEDFLEKVALLTGMAEKDVSAKFGEFSKGGENGKVRATAFAQKFSDVELALSKVNKNRVNNPAEQKNQEKINDNIIGLIDLLNGNA